MSFCDLVINLFNHCLHNNKKKKNYNIRINKYKQYKYIPKLECIYEESYLHDCNV
jgi:hypothetical protein